MTREEKTKWNCKMLIFVALLQLTIETLEELQKTPNIFRGGLLLAAKKFKKEVDKRLNPILQGTPEEEKQAYNTINILAENYAMINSEVFNKVFTDIIEIKDEKHVRK